MYSTIFFIENPFKVFKIMIMFYHIDSNVHSYLEKQ